MRLRVLTVLLLALAWLPACGTERSEPIQLVASSRAAPATVTALPELLLPVEPALEAIVDVVPAAPPVVVAPALSNPLCDGKPCGPKIDLPHEKIVCPATGRQGDDRSYTYTAGEKQLDGTCPREETAQEEIDWRCPPDEWRYDDVRIDYAAEADGCGPLVRDWLGDE